MFGSTVNLYLDVLVLIDTSIQLSHTIILLIAIVSFLMKLGSTCTLFCNKHDVIVQLATRMQLSQTNFLLKPL